MHCVIHCTCMCVAHTLVHICVSHILGVMCDTLYIYIYIYRCIHVHVYHVQSITYQYIATQSRCVIHPQCVCPLSLSHSLCLNIHSFSQCVIGTQCLSSVVIHCVIHCMCIYIYIYVIHTRCVCPLSLCQHTFLHILAITTCILPTYICVYKYIGVHHVWCIACLSSCHQTLCACTFSLRVSCVVIQCES